MSLRPAKMVKLTIVSSKRALRPTIEKLHALEAVHLVDFSEGTPGYEGFRLGKPLAEGPAASERLVRLRGLARHLDLGEHEPTTRHSARDLDRDLDTQLHQLELNITSAAEARSRLQASVEAAEKEKALLEPLAALPLRLEDYGGYKSVAVMVGRSEASVAAAVQQAVPDAEVFATDTRFVVVAPKEKAGKAGEAVARAGGQMTEAPKGTGSIQERLDALGRETQELRQRLEQTTQQLANLRQQHADFLVAAEEHLTIQSEKAEAPLSFATTEHAFIAECWVPEDQVNLVSASLRQAVGDNVHVEVSKPAEHDPHAEAHTAPAEGAAAAEGHAEGHADEEHAADVPPTQLRLAKPFQPFQFFTEMVSVPKYDEIDPTPILALVLPIFLGFMIGDAGYGILMLVLGAWMVKNLGKKVPDLHSVGVGLLASGAIAFFFGAFIFADAFGIPLGLHEAGVTCADFMSEHHETAWTCIFGNGGVVKPVLSKLEDISDLLILSVLAAFVHMALGLVFGIVNSWKHSKKHAIAKVGWFVLMVGFFAQILYMAGPAFTTVAGVYCEPEVGNGIACAVGQAVGLPKSVIPILPGLNFHPLLLGGMVLSAILLAVGEGPITVMELPTMLSNLMSYTRLAGLAIAKGAMAAAFTSLTLVAMVMEPGAGVVLVVLGLVLFVFTQMFVFVLGVFSSAIQAIRLNYVEFFNKFYTGGGVAFKPFGRKRKYTQEV